MLLVEGLRTATDVTRTGSVENSVIAAQGCQASSLAWLRVNCRHPVAPITRVRAMRRDGDQLALVALELRQLCARGDAQFGEGISHVRLDSVR